MHLVLILIILAHLVSEPLTVMIIFIYFHTASVIYGNGVHFFRDAARAISVSSPPDPNLSGFKYVYFARVLVGDFTFGGSGTVAPPSKRSNPHAFYDSVVDNVTNPSVFVIFNSLQTYPEYLIKLKWSTLI